MNYQKKSSSVIKHLLKKESNFGFCVIFVLILQVFEKNASNSNLNFYTAK